MSLTKNLLAGAAGAALLGGAAMADEPVKLTDTQMDDVTAGLLFAFGGTGGFESAFEGLFAKADLEEESSAETSESASFNENSSGSSASYSSSAKAKAKISGDFKTVLGGGYMVTGGTLAIAGNVGLCCAPD